MSGFVKLMKKIDPNYHATKDLHGRVQDKISPDMPAPKAAIAEPGEPTIDEARRAEEEANRLRRRRGLASTFLTRTFGRPSQNGNAASAWMNAAATTGPSGGTAREREYTPRRSNRAIST